MSRALMQPIVTFSGSAWHIAAHNFLPVAGDDIVGVKAR